MTEELSEILGTKEGEERLLAEYGDSVLTAARFRKELIKRYGEDRGSKVRYAGAYEVCEYGGKLTEELKEKLFNF